MPLIEYTLEWLAISGVVSDIYIIGRMKSLTCVKNYIESHCAREVVVPSTYMCVHDQGAEQVGALYGKFKQLFYFSATKFCEPYVIPGA